MVNGLPLCTPRGPPCLGPPGRRADGSQGQMTHEAGVRMRPSATAVPVSCAKAPYEGQPTAASRPGAPVPVPPCCPPAPGTWVMPVITRKLLWVGEHGTTYDGHASPAPERCAEMADTL